MQPSGMGSQTTKTLEGRASTSNQMLEGKSPTSNLSNLPATLPRYRRLVYCHRRANDHSRERARGVPPRPARSNHKPYLWPYLWRRTGTAGTSNGAFGNAICVLRRPPLFPTARVFIRNFLVGRCKYLTLTLCRPKGPHTYFTVSTLPGLDPSASFQGHRASSVGLPLPLRGGGPQLPNNTKGFDQRDSKIKQQ
jgi:hypothetical protein